MTVRPAAAILAILGVLPAAAQNVTAVPQPDPVLDAIHDFNHHDTQKPNEVTAVLDGEGEAIAPAKKNPPAAVPPPQADPVAASGKPQKETGLTALHQETNAPADLTAVTPSEQSPAPQNGLAVRIEKIHTGTGTPDPSQVKLLAPFPAKPLGPAPVGWHLDTSDSAPPFTREVELAPGSKITLTIRPHVLIPDADGANVFTISEPGYAPALGYQQSATVGAILSTSIRQLDEDSKQLGTAIDSLQQLLISLPKPESPTDAKPALLRKK